MQNLKKHFKIVMLLSCFAMLAGCGETSSPEGRMGLKLEVLQQQLLDSMQQHNRALLDSIGQLRREITAMKEAQK